MQTERGTPPATGATSRLGIALGGVIVAVSLLFDPAGWAPFGAIKWGALTVGALAVVVVVALGPVRGVIDRVSAVGWGAFLGWGIVVAIVAVDPFYAWVGTPDRHLGLLAFGVFAVVFVAAQVAPSRVLLEAAVVSLLGIGGYAVLEAVGSAPVELTTTSQRFGGPFGSAAYLAAACVLLVPIAVGLMADRSTRRGWRIAAGIAVALGMGAMVGSQTRAGVVGLVAAAGFVTVASAKFRTARVGWTLVGVSAAVALVIAVTPLGGRIADTFDGGAQGRIDEWTVGLRALVDRPVTGAGFEGYRIVFGEHVGAEYERAYGRSVTPDRAHNGALDVALATGIPGMLLYLGAMVFLARRAWRGVRSGSPWLIGLSAGVVGYFAAQQFLFPIVEVDAVAWIGAGALVAATEGDAATLALRVPALVGWLAVALAGAAVVAAGFDIGADRAIRDALEASASGNVDEAISLADSAVGLRPDSIRYWLLASEVVARDGSLRGLDDAATYLERGLEWSPSDPLLRAALASRTLDLEALGFTRSAGAPALVQWESLVSGDPNHASYRLQLGVALALSGDLEGAESEWMVAGDLAPRSAAPATNLAKLYLGLGREADATAWLERAIAIDPAYPPLEALRKSLDGGIDAP